MRDLVEILGGFLALALVLVFNVITTPAGVVCPPGAPWQPRRCEVPVQKPVVELGEGETCRGCGHLFTTGEPYAIEIPGDAVCAGCAREGEQVWLYNGDPTVFTLRSVLLERDAALQARLRAEKVVEAVVSRLRPVWRLAHEAGAGELTVDYPALRRQLIAALQSFEAAGLAAQISMDSDFRPPLFCKNGDK